MAETFRSARIRILNGQESGRQIGLESEENIIGDPAVENVAHVVNGIGGAVCIKIRENVIINLSENEIMVDEFLVPKGGEAKLHSGSIVTVNKIGFVYLK